MNGKKNFSESFNFGRSEDDSKININEDEDFLEKEINVSDSKQISIIKEEKGSFFAANTSR